MQRHVKGHALKLQFKTKLQRTCFVRLSFPYYVVQTPQTDVSVLPDDKIDAYLDSMETRLDGYFIRPDPPYAGAELRERYAVNSFGSSMFWFAMYDSGIICSWLTAESQPVQRHDIYMRSVQWHSFLGRRLWP